MVRGRGSDIILSPGRPTRPRRGFFGWLLFILGRRKREGLFLTVGPYQVGIIVWDGAVIDVFSEATQTLPEGEVQTYVASTAPFKLTFRLKGPGKSSNQYDIVLDPPLLTSDGRYVTGRVDLTVSVMAQGSILTSVIPETADRLLQLLGLSGDVVTKSDVAKMIKGELSPKLLALDLGEYTGDELQGNRELLGEISGALTGEVGSAINRFGIQLDDFQMNWASQPRETGPIERPEPYSRPSRRESRSSVPAKSTPKQTRTENPRLGQGNRSSQTRRPSASKRTTSKSTVHTSVMQQLEDSGLFDDGEPQPSTGTVSFQVKGKYAARIYVTKTEQEFHIRDSALRNNRFPNNQKLYDFVRRRKHGMEHGEGNSAYAFKLSREHIAEVIELIRSGL